MAGVVVLLSGGQDSVACGIRAATRLRACVFVDYGQPAAGCEAVFAARWASTWGVPLRTFTVGAAGATAMGGDHGASVVAGRNMLLISLALGVAAELGALEVWYGACRDDWEDYADCRPEFTAHINRARGGTRPLVTAPFIYTRKAEIHAILAAAKVPASHTWSCYAPAEGARPCGGCVSCQAARR